MCGTDRLYGADSSEYIDERAYPDPGDPEYGIRMQNRQMRKKDTGFMM